MPPESAARVAAQACHTVRTSDINWKACLFRFIYSGEVIGTHPRTKRSALSNASSAPATPLTRHPKTAP
eukprot:1025956-Prorocentrum_minimum.AAC.1